MNCVHACLAKRQAVGAYAHLCCCPSWDHAFTAADAPVLMARVAALKASLYGASANGYLKERLNAQGGTASALRARSHVLLGVRPGWRVGVAGRALKKGGQTTCPVNERPSCLPPTLPAHFPIEQASPRPMPQPFTRTSAPHTLCRQSSQPATPLPPAAAPAVRAR